MVFEQCIRSAGLAVGLMVFEQCICSAGLAVGLNPSATECEARLRGLERSNCSKTIRFAAWSARYHIRPPGEGVGKPGFPTHLLHTSGMRKGCSWEGCALPNPPVNSLSSWLEELYHC